MTPTRHSSAAPAPLAINSSNTSAARPLHHHHHHLSNSQQPSVPAVSDPTSEGSFVREMQNPSYPDAAVADSPDRSAAHKTVAFMFPPDVEEQRSVCQSPTWEAYDRRKREKKEEKKEKEQAVKDAKPKPRRLSKLPPISTNLAPPPVGDRSVSDTVIPRRNIQPKPRPSSVLGIVGFERSPAPEPPKRGRSGSLTSIIKASFEIRRSSFDRTRDTGFIGGIKLEKQRQEFTQQVLDDQAKADSKVHPALRKTFMGHGPFTPLRSPTSRKDSTDPQRRAYPPISINTASARSSSMSSSPSPSRTDFSRLHLWRGRRSRKNSDAGVSDGEDSCAVVDDSEDQGESFSRNKKAASSDCIHEAGASGLTRKGGLYIKTSPKIPAVEKHIAKKLSQETRVEDSEKPPNPAKLQKTKPNLPSELLTPEQKTHIAFQAQAQGSAATPSEGEPTSPPPPEPPRRSSKRNSRVMLHKFHPSLFQTTPYSSSAASSVTDKSSPKGFFQAYSPPNLELTHPTDSSPAMSSGSPKDGLEGPPGIPYEMTNPNTRNPRLSLDSTSSHNRWNFREAAKAAFGRGQNDSTNPPSSAASFVQTDGPSDLHRQTRGHVPSISVSGVQASSSHTTSQATPITGQYNNLPIPQSSASARRPQTSSSDDSSSDEFHSSTPMSTPPASRPMSEKEHPMSRARPSIAVIGQNYKGKNVAMGSPRTPTSGYFPGPSRTNTEDSELDPIEVAARKVMEAFPDADIRRQNNGRSQSDSNILSDMNFLPKLKQRAFKTRDKAKISKLTMAPEPPEDPSASPPLRDVLMARHDTSSAAPWPATYLEAARKAAPAAAVRSGKTHSSNASISSAKVAPLAPHPLGPAAASAPDVLARTSRHQSSSSVPQVATGDEPIAKMFVECCGCKYYHDMPSKVYEAMANPDGVLGAGEDIGGFAGRVSMTVRCPWCKHDMSTKCCAGFAAMVYIKERLH